MFKSLELPKPTWEKHSASILEVIKQVTIDESRSDSGPLKILSTACFNHEDGIVLYEFESGNLSIVFKAEAASAEMTQVYHNILQIIQKECTPMTSNESICCGIIDYDNGPTPIFMNPITGEFFFQDVMSSYRLISELAADNVMSLDPDSLDESMLAEHGNAMGVICLDEGFIVIQNDTTAIYVDADGEESGRVVEIDFDCDYEEV